MSRAMRPIHAMPPWRRNGRSVPAGTDDRGSVTAEFAIILPVAMVLALALLSLSRAVVVVLDCQDAARAAAREVVVAGDASDPVAAARAVADGASVTLTDRGDRVEVRTRCRVAPGPLDVLPFAVEGYAVGVKQW